MRPVPGSPRAHPGAVQYPLAVHRSRVVAVAASRSRRLVIPGGPPRRRSQRRMRLNHLTLTVTDVPATRTFLETYFGLQGKLNPNGESMEGERPNRNFAVL